MSAFRVDEDSDPRVLERSSAVITVQEFLAKNIFDVDRVWTQVVLEWLRQAEIISNEKFRQASALLQALRYTGNKIGADFVIEAGRLSEWHPGSLVLQRNLRVLEDNHVAPGICLEIALQFTLAVSREVRVPLSRQHLLISMLEHLRQHSDGRRIIQELIRRLPTIMELDPIRAQHAKSTIEAWLLADRQRLIPGTGRRR
jgi:hypothetical protein